MNRGTLREIAEDPDFDVTVGGPAYFHGDLRPIVFEPEPAESKLKAVALPTRLSKYIHFFWYDGKALKSLVRGQPFDLVHAWEEPYIYSGYQISQCCRDIPFCFRTAQSLNKTYPPPFSYFEKAVVKRADRWIAGASMVHETMVKRGYPADRGTILTLSVDTTAFRPLDDQAKAEVRKKLGLEDPVIGYCGRLESDKGIAVLLEALEQLKERPWSLYLMGSGSLENMIRNWASQQGLTDRVVIQLASHSEVPHYIGAMDVMVAPSQTTSHWKEQFGRMLIEAFAAGVPVIASDSGEIPITVGDAGIIVPEKDAAGYATAIRRVLDDSALRSEMITKGLARAKKFSVKALAEQYKSFYRQLATTKRSPHQ